MEFQDLAPAARGQVVPNGPEGLLALQHDGGHEWANRRATLVEPESELPRPIEVSAGVAATPTPDSLIAMEIGKLRQELCAAMREGDAALHQAIRSANDTLRQEINEAQIAVWQELRDGDSALRRETRDGDASLRHEVRELRSELRAEFSDAGAAVKQEMSDLRFDFVKWSLAFWIAHVLIIAGIIATMLQPPSG